MNKRILELRKGLKLSQEAFGRRISISGAALSRIENGVNNPSQQTVNLICREFSVNEEWLKTGNGDMFIANDDSTIAAVCEKHHFSAIERKMLEAYIALPESYREGVLQYVEKLVTTIVSDSNAYQEIANKQAEDENQALRNNPVFSSHKGQSDETEAHA